MDASKKNIGKADLKSLIEEERRNRDLIWLQGVVERLTDEEGSDRLTLRLLAAPTVLEFEASDVAVSEELEDGMSRIGVSCDAVFLIHHVTTFSQPTQFAPLLRSLPADSLGLLQEGKARLGEWLLTQKSHGHMVVAPTDASSGTIDLGEWLLTQRSHGHRVVAPTDTPSGTIDLGEWLLSQKSHGHSVTATDPVRNVITKGSQFTP